MRWAADQECSKLWWLNAHTAQVSKGVPAWKAYVDYFSNIVIDGFSNAITCTIRYLLNQVGGQRVHAHAHGCCCPTRRCQTNNTTC